MFAVRVTMIDRYQQTQQKWLNIGTGYDLVSLSHLCWPQSQSERYLPWPSVPKNVFSYNRHCLVCRESFQVLQETLWLPLSGLCQLLQTLAMFLPTHQVYVTDNPRESSLLIMGLYKSKVRFLRILFGPCWIWPQIYLGFILLIVIHSLNMYWPSKVLFSCRYWDRNVYKNQSVPPEAKSNAF